MSFNDHFSGHSSQYSVFRPEYPQQLFTWLAKSCDEHNLAWDCATGSGQAAGGLTRHFESVIATDASANQIANAKPYEGVSYHVAQAEDSGIASASVDLITVAQALHWFDLDRFAAEAKRVLKSNGVLAVWTYGLMKIDPGLNTVIHRLYDEIVGDFWPFERRMVEDGYTAVTMPFSELPIMPFEMSATWGFSELLGYLNTWSAVRACEKAKGVNPLEHVLADLAEHWGDIETARVVTWPLVVKAWRKT